METFDFDLLSDDSDFSMKKVVAIKGMERITYHIIYDASLEHDLDKILHEDFGKVSISQPVEPSITDILSVAGNSIFSYASSKLRNFDKKEYNKESLSNGVVCFRFGTVHIYAVDESADGVSKYGIKCIEFSDMTSSYLVYAKSLEDKRLALLKSYFETDGSKDLISMRDLTPIELKYVDSFKTYVPYVKSNTNSRTVGDEAIVHKYNNIYFLFEKGDKAVETDSTDPVSEYISFEVIANHAGLAKEINFNQVICRNDVFMSGNLDTVLSYLMKVTGIDDFVTCHGEIHRMFSLVRTEANPAIVELAKKNNCLVCTADTANNQLVSMPVKSQSINYKVFKVRYASEALANQGGIRYVFIKSASVAPVLCYVAEKYIHVPNIVSKGDKVVNGFHFEPVDISNNGAIVDKVHGLDCEIICMDKDRNIVISE